MAELVTEARKIVRKKEVCGGVPLLDGTRIRVSDVTVQHEYFGLSPEEITSEFPALSLADVYAALTYYHEHPREIREEIKAREKFFEEVKRQQHLFTDSRALPS